MNRKALANKSATGGTTPALTLNDQCSYLAPSTTPIRAGATIPERRVATRLVQSSVIASTRCATVRRVAAPDFKGFPIENGTAVSACECQRRNPHVVLSASVRTLAKRAAVRSWWLARFIQTHGVVQSEARPRTVLSLFGPGCPHLKYATALDACFTDPVAATGYGTELVCLDLIGPDMHDRPAANTRFLDWSWFHDSIIDQKASLVNGAGTTMLVADRLGRHGVGVELNNDYCRMARRRCYEDAPLLAFAHQEAAS